MGIELVELFDALMNPLGRDAQLLRQLRLLFRRVRQELVQRRVEETNRRRKSLECAEDAGEVVALIRQQLGERGLPLLERFSKDHLAHRVDAIAFEEHVLGPAEADADGPECERVLRLLRRVGVGAHDHAGRLVAPLHQLLEALELLGLLRRFVVVHERGHDFRRRGRDAAGEDLPCRAVDREPVAFLEGLAVYLDGARVIVDFERRCAADADFAHLPSDERRVRGHAATRRENAFRRDHAAEIFRRGLDADKQHLLAFFRRDDRAIGVEINLARRGARTGRQAGRDDGDLGGFFRVEHRRQQLIELVGRVAHDGRLPVDELLFAHVHRELERGHRRPLAVARLEHVEHAVFDGELEVLHVLEMLLETLADHFELAIRLRQVILQLRDRLRRPHAGDDVFALRVDEKLAVELFHAVRRIARERHARPRLIARVAVHHRLHVDGRAPLRRNVVLAAIDDCAIVHPRAEHRADGSHQLVPRRGREILADAILDQLLEAAHEFLQVVWRQRRVFDDLAVSLVLQRFDDRFERLVIFIRRLLHAEDDVAVHLHEAAVAVPRKARVARLLRERFDGLIVEAEVEDRVHHARHRIARARAHGDEQRVLHVAEFLARLLLERGDARLHLRLEDGGIRPLVVVEVGADLGGNREPRGNRQADPAHLGQVRALAAEQRLHAAVAVGLALPEKIDVLPFGCGRALLLGHVRSLSA